MQATKYNNVGFEDRFGTLTIRQKGLLFKSDVLQQKKKQKPLCRHFHWNDISQVKPNKSTAATAKLKLTVSAEDDGDIENGGGKKEILVFLLKNRATLELVRGDIAAALLSTTGSGQPMDSDGLDWSSSHRSIPSRISSKKSDRPSEEDSLDTSSHDGSDRSSGGSSKKKNLKRVDSIFNLSRSLSNSSRSSPKRLGLGTKLLLDTRGTSSPRRLNGYLPVSLDNGGVSVASFSINDPMGSNHGSARGGTLVKQPSVASFFSNDSNSKDSSRGSGISVSSFFTNESKTERRRDTGKYADLDDPSIQEDQRHKTTSKCANPEDEFSVTDEEDHTMSTSGHQNTNSTTETENPFLENRGTSMTSFFDDRANSDLSCGNGNKSSNKARPAGVIVRTRGGKCLGMAVATLLVIVFLLIVSNIILYMSLDILSGRIDALSNQVTSLSSSSVISTQTTMAPGTASPIAVAPTAAGSLTGNSAIANPDQDGIP